jgi:hypothetical protein
MTLVRSRDGQAGGPRRWLTEPERETPTSGGRRWDFASPLANRRSHRRRTPAARVLRIAPRLSIVRGNRSGAHRAATAHRVRPTGGMFFDPDDAPSCA